MAAPRATTTPPQPMRQRRDGFARIVEIDAATEAAFGWSASETVGRRAVDFIHPDDHGTAFESWVEMIGEPAGVRHARIRWRRADGAYVWVDVRNENRLDTEGVVLTELTLASGPATGITLPATEPANADSRPDTDVGAGTGAGDPTQDAHRESIVDHLYREHERAVSRLTETLPLGIAQVTAHHRIAHANTLARTLFGVTSADTVDELVTHVDTADRAALDAALTAALRERRHHDTTVRCRPPGAPSRDLLVHVQAFSDDRGIEALLCVDDVTESVRLRSELERHATTDELTGCRNRRSILTRLDASLRAGPVAAVFIDLDDFKGTNDRYGHAAGDALLVEIARRIRIVVGDADSVGRLGGDEFLAVVPGGDRDSAIALARRISSAISAPFAHHDAFIEPRASIGVAADARAVRDADSLIAAADAAMYRSKRHGGPVDAVELHDGL